MTRTVRQETRLPAKAVSKAASLHRAVKGERDIHQQCGLGGWPGPHFFLTQQFAVREGSAGQDKTVKPSACPLCPALLH
jgi:hypothetical protein